MKLELNEQHLWVPFGDRREVIIDKERDVRICDGRHIVKVVFDPGGSICAVLVDDLFVWQHRKAGKSS